MKKKSDSANYIAKVVEAVLTTFSYIPSHLKLNNNLNLEFLF